MKAEDSPRPMTFRVENIEGSTAAEDLLQDFYTEDKPHVK